MNTFYVFSINLDSTIKHIICGSIRLRKYYLNKIIIKDCKNGVFHFPCNMTSHLININHLNKYTS